MNDLNTLARREWLAKLQRLRIKRNRQMAVPIYEPLTERMQVVLRNIGGVKA